MLKLNTLKLVTLILHEAPPPPSIKDHAARSYHAFERSDSEASHWGEHPIALAWFVFTLIQMHKRNLMLGAAVLVTLAGCVGYVEEPRGRVYVTPPVVAPTVVVQDDYVYYPAYETYYSSSRRHYLYMDRGAWVSRPAPRQVSSQRLLASPSVRVDFHDSPAQHHAAIVRQYPKNWKPSAPAQGQKHDERGENTRR